MSAPALDAKALAGRVLLRPGPALPGLPTLHSTRPDWVPRLSAGRRAEQLPTLLAGVFSLCGHAHHWASRRAIAAAAAAAACGQPVGGAAVAAATSAQTLAADVQGHRLATLREHILRISHDWPMLLPGAPLQPDVALLLRACPVWREDLPAPERLAALPEWLAQKWLGQAVADWLRAHEDAPSTWAAQWAARARTPLARLLHGQHAALAALSTPALALEVLGQAGNPPSALPELAQLMAQPGFCAQPSWQGSVPDTGPWSRQADPLRGPARSAWHRLLARLVEVLRLAQPDAQSVGGDAWLAHGALSLGAGLGLAWVEMARGLLIHRVQLAGDGTVQACQVLAPTEWNFHPEGVLAQALRCLPATAPAAELDAAARRLAVAFDPCVAFDIAPFSPVAGENRWEGPQGGASTCTN